MTEQNQHPLTEANDLPVKSLSQASKHIRADVAHQTNGYTTIPFEAEAATDSQSTPEDKEGYATIPSKYIPVPSHETEYMDENETGHTQRDREPGETIDIGNGSAAKLSTSATHPASSSQEQHAAVASPQQPAASLAQSSDQIAHATQPRRTKRLQPGESKWIPWIVVIIIPLIILTTIVSASMTVFSPTLRISEGTTVNYGAVLHLQGRNFIPRTKVALTLDGSSIHSAGLRTVENDGTFTTTLVVQRTWKPGPHILGAVETLNLRSASVSFTIPSNNPLTGMGSTQSTEAATPDATNTTTPLLETLTPNTLNLGSVGEGATKPVASHNVILSTSSPKNITWSAQWDQTKAPWLQLAPATGQLQAARAQTITIQALASQLKAGNYNAHVTISTPTDYTRISFTVLLTVQRGCIDTSTENLKFTENADSAGHSSDPTPQTITILDCALAGSWSAQTSGEPWLHITPNTGALASGGSQYITVTASNQKVPLKAGTYASKVIIRDGSDQLSIPVTFTVQPAPTPTVSPSPVQ
jgi:hypothetical protein